MKGYLLDTHTLIWMQEDQSLLSPPAQQIIADEKNWLYASIVSFWEITIKQSLGKLQIKHDLSDLANACVINKIGILPINLYQLQTLSFLHRDPFDRLLVATAYTNGFDLISKNRHLRSYNINIIW